MRATEHLYVAEGHLEEWKRADWEDDANLQRLIGALTHSVVALTKAQLQANKLLDERLDLLASAPAFDGYDPETTEDGALVASLQAARAAKGGEAA